MRKWNFCAGPAVISEDVLQEVKSELLEFNNAGASITDQRYILLLLRKQKMI